MKAIIISSAALLWSVLSFGQTIPEQGTQTALTPPSAVFLSSDRAVTASAQTSENNSEYADWHGYGRVREVSCERLKRQRTIGMALTCVGAAMLGGGIAMTVVGNNAINNNSYYDPYNGYFSRAPQNDYALRNGGVALSIVGTAFLAIGIPNWITGAVRYRRNCGGVFDRGASMELRPGLNSMGMAMKF